MTFKRPLLRAVAVAAVAGLAGLADGGISAAYARPSRAPRAPVLAVVGLAEQRISIYDTTGAKMMESAVSSGATGYETPAGIYSVVQKEEEHHSNLYDDASMPFMERITWTGMALHAGVLPGYPASHGCVRLPAEFAQQLYDVSKLGMRVVVVREEMAPVEIAEPALFKPNGTKTETQLADATATAKARNAEAAAATSRARVARQAATSQAADAAQAGRKLRAAEASLASAEAAVKAAERALEKADTPAKTALAEETKTKAFDKLKTVQDQVQAAKSQAQSMTDAAAQAAEEARVATAAMNSAVNAAEEAKQNLSPVSVFISRKTQRLYIRRNNYPVFEGPVTIRDADKPIGTFVFTALGFAEASGDMRWNVVSMYKNPTNIEPFQQAQRSRTKTRRGDPVPVTDAAAAQAALDRLVVPQEASELISAAALPGSSLIISDEGPSTETGKDTDFVVFMSGEPQGGIAIRRRDTVARAGRDGDDDYSPWGSTRGRRSSSSSSGGIFQFLLSD